MIKLQSGDLAYSTKEIRITVHYDKGRILNQNIYTIPPGDLLFFLKEIGNDALFYYPKNQACLLFAMNCYSIYINLKKFETEQCLTYPK